MSETVKPISQSGVSKTLTLTTEYQDLFSYSIEHGTVDINMYENGVDIGTLKIIVGGGLAKTDVGTGGLYFDQPIDNTRFPTLYTPYSHEMNYTVKFYYNNSKIQVAKEVNDPDITLTFTAQYSSSMEKYPDSVLSTDKLVENTADAGIEVSNTLKITGGVEMSNLPNDTITFNQNHQYITFTNVSSRATRVGKLCNIVVKATLSCTGTLIPINSVHDFFSVTPTNSYTCSYVQTGTAMDGATNVCSAIFNDANTADFKLVMPKALSDGASMTVYASISYVAS